MTTTPEQIEAVARMRLMIQSAVEDDARAWELTDTELAVIAEAAINTMRPVIRAEVLEEAAKVADGYHRTKEVTRDLMDDGNITTTTVRSLADPLKIAAAIRALKEKKDV